MSWFDIFTDVTAFLDDSLGEVWPRHVGLESHRFHLPRVVSGSCVHCKGHISTPCTLVLGGGSGQEIWVIF